MSPEGLYTHGAGSQLSILGLNYRLAEGVPRRFLRRCCSAVKLAGPVGPSSLSESEIRVAKREIVRVSAICVSMYGRKPIPVQQPGRLIVSVDSSAI